ncbi:MAG: kelch repeat-containing protein [Saprospiraceae bacterium]
MKLLYLLLISSLAAATSLDAQTARLKFQKLKPLPYGRYDMAYATDGELIYLIGGSGHRQNLNSDIFTYLVKYGTWLKLRTGLPFENRKKGAAVFLPTQNRIYLIGGVGEYQPDYAPSRNQAYLLKDIEYIDTRTKRLEKWGPNQHRAASVGVSTWNGKLYMFGGAKVANDERFGFNYLADFNELDPLSGEWKSLPSMPHAKETQGCIIDGILYTFGGFNGATFREIHGYDLAKGEWRKIGDLPNPLRSHVVTSWKNFVFLIGDVTKQDYLAIYDTSTGETREFKTNMNGHSRGACVINDKLYVFGGLLFSTNNATKDTLFVLDLKELFNK